MRRATSMLPRLAAVAGLALASGALTPVPVGAEGGSGSVLDRAEALAREGRRRFDESLARQVSEMVVAQAQRKDGAAPTQGDSTPAARTEEGLLEPVFGWLRRSGADYDALVRRLSTGGRPAMAPPAAIPI